MPIELAGVNPSREGYKVRGVAPRIVYVVALPFNRKLGPERILLIDWFQGELYRKPDCRVVREIDWIDLGSKGVELSRACEGKQT